MIADIDEMSKPNLVILVVAREGIRTGNSQHSTNRGECSKEVDIVDLGHMNGTHCEELLGYGQMEKKGFPC